MLQTSGSPASACEKEERDQCWVVGTPGKLCPAKNREAANTRAEFPQQKLGLAVGGDNSASTRDKWQFCLGPSWGNTEASFLPCCPVWLQTQNTLRPTTRFGVNPLARPLSPCAGCPRSCAMGRQGSSSPLCFAPG